MARILPEGPQRKQRDNSLNTVPTGRYRVGRSISELRSTRKMAKNGKLSASDHHHVGRPRLAAHPAGLASRDVRACLHANGDDPQEADHASAAGCFHPAIRRAPHAGPRALAAIAPASAGASAGDPPAAVRARIPEPTRQLPVPAGTAAESGGRGRFSCGEMVAGGSTQRHCAPALIAATRQGVNECFARKPREKLVTISCR